MKTTEPDSLTGPEPYDFDRPASLSREHNRALASAFDAFARQWSMQLTSKIRLRSLITLREVTMETYDQYVTTVPATTTVVSCGETDSSERGIIEFPLSTALTWIVKMIGGDPSKLAEDRALTALEQALLRGLMDETVGNLRACMGDVLPETFAVNAIQYNAAFAQIAAAQDMVIVGRFDVQIGDLTQHASVAIPARFILERLSHGSDVTEDEPELLRETLAETPVEVTLRLHPRSILPGEVLSLSEGDVLTLTHSKDKALEVAIGDLVVAEAAIGKAGNRLACHVNHSFLSESIEESR